MTNHTPRLSRTRFWRTALLAAGAAAVLALLVLASCSGGLKAVADGAQLIAKGGSGVAPPWSMFGKNAMRTFRSSHRGPANGNTKWSYSPTANILTETVFAVDGTVYFGTDLGGGKGPNNSALFALSPAGKKKWAYSLVGQARFPNVGPDGTIYLIGSDTYKPEYTLYALNPNGTLKWKKVVSTTKSFKSMTLLNDGTFVLTTSRSTGGTAKVSRLDSNGNHIWSWETTSQINGSAAIAEGGTIYIGLSSDPQEPGTVSGLQAINPSGSPLWFYETELGASGPSVAEAGTIYIGTWYNGQGSQTPGKLVAINPDGSLNWQYDLPGRAYNQPAISSDGTVIITCNRTEPGLQNAVVAANPDGSLKWSYSFGELQMPGTYPALDADGNCYVGFNYNGDGTLVALNSNGTFRWSTGLQGGVFASARTIEIGEDGSLYVGASYVDRVGPMLFVFGPGTP